MDDLDENATPEPIPDVDPQSVDQEPSAEEYFVLSRVDGSMTVDQLGKTCGLGPQKTRKCLDNLRNYGLIRLPGQETKTGTSATESTPSSSSSGDADATSDKESDTEKPDLTTSIRERFPADFSDFEFDSELLEQEVELEAPFKREVLFVHAQLEEVDHYQLLDVDRDAQRRSLRSAYFKMSKRYHPDRFYKKILGGYEAKIEAIFQRVTKAYQTLTNDRKRQEYDNSLDAGQTHDDTTRTNATPASRRSEPREAMKGDQKRDMAYKVLLRRSDEAIEEGRIAEAVDGYRKALSLQRNADLALRVARQLLEREVHLDDATSFARAAQKIDSSPEALKLIGEIYEHKGAKDDALYHYEKALEAVGDDPGLEQRIARLGG